MTTAVNTATKGLTVVGLALKDGQLPDGLQVGDHVSIFSTSDNEGRCPRPPTNVLAPTAVVLNIGHPVSTASDAVDDVQVAVAPGYAAGVSCNAANNNVGVGVLPAGGRGATPVTPSSGGTNPSPGSTVRSRGSASPSGGPAAPSPGGTTPPPSGGTG